MKRIHRWEFLAMGLSLFVLPLIGCSGGGTPDPNPTPTPTPGGASYRMVLLVPDALLSKNSEGLAMNAAGTMQGGSSYTTTVDSRALIWSGTSASMVDLGPGEIRALEGDVQIGMTGTEGTASERAQLWRGSEASRVSLHPAGYTSSHAVGGDASVQVGRGRPTAATSHALLWRGTAASVVDLHPTGYTFSRAYGGGAAAQVGEARKANGDFHAVLWRGTPESVVDLGNGIAWAVSGDTQVGWIYSNGARAVLWRGTEASRVDLHPAGFEQSRVFGVAGNRQVGDGDLAGGKTHAIVWEGTAASAVDLHSTTQNFLINGVPPGFSYARGIDNNGNIVGTVRAADGGLSYAVRWERI